MKKQHYLLIVAFLVGALVSSIINFFVSYTIVNTSEGIYMENNKYWKGWEDSYKASFPDGAVTWDELEKK